MPRGVKGSQPVALSRYRQLRLTVTQEASGRVSYSLYGKALNADWREHDCLLRDSLGIPPRALLSTEDVIALMLDVLRAQLIPGID